MANELDQINDVITAGQARWREKTERGEDPYAEGAVITVAEELNSALSDFSTQELAVTAPSRPIWRVGRHYGIHVYEGDRPVATFFREEDAREAVAEVNAARRDQRRS